jgi:hypothetical protein
VLTPAGEPPNAPSSVTTAHGDSFSYRVTARNSYNKNGLPPALFATDGPARLVLITCGGSFDRSTLSYQDNVVVCASLAITSSTT